MSESITGQRKRNTGIMLMACLLLSSQVVRADYLSELENEAQKLEAMGDKPAEPASEVSNWSPNPDGNNTTLQPNLNRKGFEENLQFVFIGTYAVYTRLNETQKQQAYDAYKNGTDVDGLKVFIRELYNQL